MAYSYLTTQPYFSLKANNYKFSIFFTLATISYYNLIMILSKLIYTQFFADILLVVIMVLLLCGYNVNKYYNKRVLMKIYKKLAEKDIVENLKKNVTKEEFAFKLSKDKSKNIYKSVDRISRIFFFFYFLLLL